jgi:plastocyanin
VRRLVTACLLGLLLTLAGCSGSKGEESNRVATNQVDLPKSYMFRPSDITVEKGTTVTWTNNDQFTHSVRLLDGEKGNKVMKPGEKAEYQFKEPGLYHYDCSFHPQNMKGTVQVT